MNYQAESIKRITWTPARNPARHPARQPLSSTPVSSTQRIATCTHYGHTPDFPQITFRPAVHYSPAVQPSPAQQTATPARQISFQANANSNPRKLDRQRQRDLVSRSVRCPVVPLVYVSVNVNTIESILT